MFLRLLACAAGLGLGMSAHAQFLPATQHNWTDTIVGSHLFYVGVDHWAIETSAESDTLDNMNSVSRLQLANSYPVSDYRDTSAWLRFEGGLRIGSDTLLNLRFRTNQVQGPSLDEAALDQALNAFGLRVGVVDPRISWCRTYDMDSPWVRENNPFCTIQPLNFAKSSSPGAQAYVHHIWGHYSLQALVGSYHPLVLGFADDEFPTFPPPEGMRATTHHKLGAAFSASNLRDGTELRLGWMQGDFLGTLKGPTPESRTVSSDVWFAGLNWYIQRNWALRTTYFTYDGQYQRRADSSPPFVERRDTREYRAVTYELNHQASARDIWAVSYAIYDFDISGSTFVPINGVSTTQAVLIGAPHFQTRNLSLSWRHDWGTSAFVVIQASQARTQQRSSNGFRTRYAESDGKAMGVRLGYRF
jgi:hypothetical protein